MNPKVSVILSIYNVEKYIEKCVSSVLSQTFQDFEVIMVDDGSTDNCPKISDSYKEIDNRITVIHKENQGLGYARNTGLEAANGEYVCFFDSDDFFDKEMLSKMYSLAQRNSLDAIVCGFRRVDINGYPIKEQPEVETYTEIIGHKNNILHVLSIIEPLNKGRNNYSMSVCKAMFNRLFLIENNLRFKSERDFISEDMIFDIDFFLRANKVGIIPETYYNYRFNPESLTHKKKPDLYKRFKKQFEEVLNRLMAGGIYESELLNAAYRYLICSTNSVVYSAIANDYPRPEVNDIFIEISSDKQFWQNVLKKYPIEKMESPHRQLLKSILKKRIWMWRVFVFLSKIKNHK